MGSGQSSQQQQQFFENLSQNYKCLSYRSDIESGSYQIYRKLGHDEYIIVRSKMCQYTDEFLTLKELLQNSKLKNHANVLSIVEFSQTNLTFPVCGSMNQIQIATEFFQNTLQLEMNYRINNNLKFSEPEAWYLLQSVIKACNFFEQQKIFNGDIRPKHIFLTPQGKVKIADSGLLEDKNGYMKVMTQNDHFCFLSPQLMKELDACQMDPIHNVYKSDVYSLGMTMLEVLTQENALQCYDYHNNQIINKQIALLIGQARGRYSELLVNIVSDMLTYEEAERPDWNYLFKKLAPYDQSISKMQGVDINSNAPEPQQFIQIHDYSLQFDPEKTIEEIKGPLPINNKKEIIKKSKRKLSSFTQNSYNNFNAVTSTAHRQQQKQTVQNYPQQQHFNANVNQQGSSAQNYVEKPYQTQPYTPNIISQHQIQNLNTQIPNTYDNQLGSPLMSPRSNNYNIHVTSPRNMIQQVQHFDQKPLRQQFQTPNSQGYQIPVHNQMRVSYQQQDQIQPVQNDFQQSNYRNQDDIDSKIQQAIKESQATLQRLNYRK